MFDPLNLFKSVNCPYYNSISNAITCERPYCQFRHPPKQQSNSASKQEEHASSEPVNNKPIEAEIPKKTNDDDKIKQLPSALENLSSALEAVQKLFNLGSQSIKANNDTKSNDKNELATTLVNQLSTLTSAITNIAKKEETNDDHAGKAKKLETNLKRQQQAAPEYNPTPIFELKKLKQTEQDVNSNEIENDIDTSSTNIDNNNLNNLKRKRSLEELAKPIAKTSAKKTSLSLSASSDNVSNKSNMTPTSASSAISTKSEQSTPTQQSKCDIFTFSKLTLSQQVLKRYEMLNKEIPLHAKDPKLKKKANDSSPANSTSTAKNLTGLPTIILDSNGSPKIPLQVRQRYLKVIFDNGKSLFTNIEKACEKASEQEKSIYDRAKNKNIYVNLAANLIKSLRTQQQQELTLQTKSNNESNTIVSTSKTLINNNNLLKYSSTHISSASSSTSNVSSYSHEAMLSGPKASKVSYSINRIKQVEHKDLTVTELYEMFCKYVLNEKQLQDNSFPDWLKTNNENNKKRLAYIPNFSNSTDQLNKQLIKKVDSSILVKICKRCNKTFQLNSIDMTYSFNNSDCVFHWGKIRNQRFNKLVEQKYSCCSNEANSEGCEVGKHVYDGDYDGNGIGTNISDYVETQEDPTPSSKQSSNIYALDCEMCYTTRGLELARVSIVDINLKEVYDSIVKPDGQILDYNTRWSGLIEDSFKNCTKKLKNVQNDLLKMFNKNTILIGHSLDSDFKALKLIHKKVIDTSVVFPHKMGPPLKRALKNLMSEYLQRIIQEDTDGHDSKEDASACIQLMLWKINEDLKNKSNIKKYSQQNFKSNQTSSSLSIAQSSSSSSVIHHYHKKNIQNQESINKNINNNSKYRQNNFINNQTNNNNTNNNSKSATNKYKLISPNY